MSEVRRDTANKGAVSRVVGALTKKGLFEASVTARSAASAETVRARADALTSALASGVGCLPAGGVHRAEVAIKKAAARTSMSGAHTVVALAGATGSGKSSLFN